MKPHKVGFKSRSGRKRSPTVHGKHRHKTTGARAARILRARLREAFAPQVSDFTADALAPMASGVHVTPLLVNSGRSADTPGRSTQRSTTSYEH